MDKLLSVVIPAFNEEESVEAAARTVTGVLRGAGIDFEIIFVDDGSTDTTWEAVLRAHEADRRVRGVSLSRNFGKDRAIFAGLSKARGDCAAVLDCDLQHPPAVLPEMYALWERGFEVVEGVKADRGEESGLHRACAGIFNAVIGRLAKIGTKRSSDFILMDRKAVDALLALPEEEVFFRGLVSYLGFRRAEVEFDVGRRLAGSSKWSFMSLARYAAACITSFSAVPMQLATVFGVFFAIVAVVTGILYAVLGLDPEGWLVFLAVMGLLAAACLLMCLGVAGYYLGRVFRQGLGRPRFIISRECGD